jgi:uncharacterized protein YdhG (YjbR/CyaY superfamily)
MDDAVQAYIDAIPAEHRELFDRLQELILAAHPDASVLMSYKMPTYKVGRRKLYLGSWRHGISIYGWQRDRDSGFASRHPELLSGAATIQLRPQDAAVIPDEEFSDLVNAALKP